MFRAYLKVADRCPVCGEDLSHQRADDAPAYLTMFVVGHFIVAGILAGEDLWPNSPIWLVALPRLRRRDARFALVAAAHQGRADRLSMGDAHAWLRRAAEGIHLIGRRL